MRAGGAGSPLEALAERKQAIIREWLARTLRSYPDLVSRFLSSEEDPFRNPVGHTLKHSFGPLLDAILHGVDAARVTGALEAVIRLRAVQDFRPGQAVGFLFLVKSILREHLVREIPGEPAGDALALLDRRVDELALLAFDLFMQCRERLYEIRLREARRRIGILLKREAHLPVPDSPMPRFTDTATEDCYTP
jgi:hypothetical protein